MKLIIGLGNPGAKYAKTRHNLGFMVLEQFLKDFEPVEKTTWSLEEKLKSDVTLLDWQARSSRSFSGQAKKGEKERVILAKPKTYMNNSGMAVSLVVKFYKVKPEDVWVVYDEIDLPLGSMKIRFGGATAGHHGVDSVMEALSTDKFWRFRMGIGVMKNHGGEETIAHHKHKNVEDHVLGNITSKDRSKVKDLITRGSKALKMALDEGLDSAMNRFNTK